MILHFSSFVRLQRVYAYVLRFINKVRFRTPESITSPETAKTLLSVTDLKCSQELLVRIVQSHYYDNKISLIKLNVIPPSFRVLKPFLDDVGLMRGGGRLRHASIAPSSKHPLILPK